MNINEIKQLINASGGKLILSDGDLKESFIVMKIGDYLLEKECECDCCDDEEMINSADFMGEGNNENENLTDSELLDKINADIEELKRRKQESDLVSLMESEFGDSQKEEELNYEKI